MKNTIEMKSLILSESNDSNCSCAMSMLRCLADSGIIDKDKVFAAHIENAKRLGLMPDDRKTINETLLQYGFALESSVLEGRYVKELMSMCSNFKESTVVLIQVIDMRHSGGLMLAFRGNAEGALEVISKLPDEDSLEHYRSRHVWIRSIDGTNPFPRRKAKSKKTEEKKRTCPPEMEWYHPFQPNPCDNYIGDCVVRGIAGALHISWEQAIDKLAAFGDTSINAPRVYEQLLEKEGFKRYGPIIRNGRRLTGKAFCEEMNRVCLSGQSVVAYVGKSHLAAVLPTSETRTKPVYKIWDCWDSSNCLIGEYWILSPGSVGAHLSAETKAIGFKSGDIIRHRIYGDGVVEAVSSGIVTVNFGEKGIRRLGEEWMLKNCILK